MNSDNPWNVQGAGGMTLGDNNAAHRLALRILFDRPTEIDRPDNYSRRPARSIHSASVVRDK